MKILNNKTGCYLLTYIGSLDLNLGKVRAILNWSGKYDISIYLLKIFDNVTEINTVKIFYILVGILRWQTFVNLSPTVISLISLGVIGGKNN